MIKLKSIFGAKQQYWRLATHKKICCTLGINSINAECPTWGHYVVNRLMLCPKTILLLAKSLP